MLYASIFIGKMLLILLKLVGRRGSALPGLIIEKINPSFLQKTLGQLPGGVIIVTGTNGKTTTTKIITSLLESQNKRVLTNETGSNFVRGIIATTVEKIGWNAKLPYDIAVIEQDEAYAVRFVQHVKPKGLVALNVMRDQMDRFGEIDTTAKFISTTAESVTDWLVLNANDPRIAAIARQRSDLTVSWFGHDASLTAHFVSDDQHHRGSAIEFFEAARPDSRLVSIDEKGIAIELKGAPYRFKPKLEGTHNALNITAAAAAFEAIVPEYSHESFSAALENIEPAFGRGEQIILKNGGRIHLQLVKNPSGFTHSLRLLDGNRYDLISIAINDRHADGRDVSWLWDVDFTPVVTHGVPVICGGVRGYDMALRLKYENEQVAGTHTDDNDFLKQILSRTQSQDNTILFCTYTAMLGLRKLLKKHSSQMNKEGL